MGILRRIGEVFKEGPDERPVPPLSTYAGPLLMGKVEIHDGTLAPPSAVEQEDIDAVEAAMEIIRHPETGGELPEWGSQSAETIDKIRTL